MTSRYRDYGYTIAGHASGAAGHALATKFVSIVSGLGRVKSVCDLGCGNGYLASLLGNAGFAVTGVDASPSGIDVAKRHYSADNVDFLCVDFDASDVLSQISGAPFDAIVSSDVIEHLYRPASLIEIARSILKPSGHLIVGTPYHGYVKNLAIAVAGKWDTHHGPNWNGGHIKFFSVGTLEELIEKHGFVGARFEFHGRAPLLWKNMICIARKSGG